MTVADLKFSSVGTLDTRDFQSDLRIVDIMRVRTTKQTMTITVSSRLSPPELQKKATEHGCIHTDVTTSGTERSLPHTTHTP